ncbi:2'-5' RNA ligase family protein [Aestuariicoccus sp. MJ-SS9]|uniref:2'-5' RNA ligase family protein n=1 Tax=Aestuariicoccus sp. MJ-SS9 TaxID=3079855 RepID=UPI0029061EFA|nr:2'-5' RNA ligase family protein [Aestuariicoccus sp. MJ-SS9]MDU8909645.1 2'-5' RNA ligase family protein [Aestuariicoccus sp. MJ-SS9]
MIYVLAYPEFERGVAQGIDRFRSLHEPDRARMVRPHITLVFGSRREDADTLLGLCEDVSRTTPKLTIAFSGTKVAWDPFDKAHKLFLTCGRGARTLTALHRRLYEGPHRHDLRSDLPYAPHMTVATNADQTVIEGLDVADIGALPITGTVKALELVEATGDRLNARATIPFRT